jgi:sugar lactone lactonase YvrE
VQVFDPAGQLLGEICLPGAVNFCFGGAEHDLLLITTDSAVWAAQLAAKGV